MYNSKDPEEETTDEYLPGNRTYAKNVGSNYNMHPLSSYLSFNMYKFNYEIGKKEYVIDGKAERRLRSITENNRQGAQEIQNCQSREVQFDYKQFI